MSCYQTKQTQKFEDDGFEVISFTSDFRHFIFSVHADANTTATVRVKGSAQNELPDFSAASSASNDWGYVGIRELENANLINGATGVVISNTTHQKLYEVECNGLTHIAFDVSSVSGDGIVINSFIRKD